MMINKLLTISILIVMLPLVMRAQQELATIEKKFEIIDVAVRLIEHYPDLKVDHLMDKTPPFKDYPDKKFLDIVKENTSDAILIAKPTIDLFVIAYLKNLEKGLNSTIKSDVKDLFHHAKKLFNQTNVNGGKDFDESLLAVYHIHRANFKILVELEKLKKYQMKEDTTRVTQVIRDTLGQQVILVLEKKLHIQWDVDTGLTKGSDAVFNQLLLKITELDNKQAYLIQCMDKLKDEWIVAQAKTNYQLDYLTKTSNGVKKNQHIASQPSQYFRNKKLNYKFYKSDSLELKRIEQIASNDTLSYRKKRKDIKKVIK